MDVVIKTLSDKSAAFLKDQTQLNPDMIKTLEIYTGPGYKKINKVLRETKGNIDSLPESDETKKDIMLIDKLFSRADPITEPITLYRGVGREAYTTKQDYAFISASCEIETAVVFTNLYNLELEKKKGERRTCCLIEINVPVGTRCIFLEEISLNPGEKEVLLPRNGKFILTSVGLSTDSSNLDTYFVTFVPHTAEEFTVMSDTIVKGHEKLKILEKVVETVEKEATLEAHYQANSLLYSKKL